MLLSYLQWHQHKQWPKVDVTVSTSFSSKYDSNVAVCVHCVRLVRVQRKSSVLGFDYPLPKVSENWGRVTWKLHATYTRWVSEFEALSEVHISCDRLYIILFM